MKKAAGFKIMSWSKRQKLPGSMKSVLRAVAEYADVKGTAWPSQAMLANDTGLCLRAVRDALSKLEYFGLIRRMKRGNGRGGRSSDLVVLTIDREFIITKSDIKKAAELAAANSGKSKWGYRQQTTELPAAAAEELPENYQVDTKPSRARGLCRGTPVISEGMALDEIPAGRILH